MAVANRLPRHAGWGDTVRFLTHNQFPVILEQNVKFSGVLPEVGVYNKQTRKEILPFRKALLEQDSRIFTLSGIGSLVDTERFGHQIRKPTPQLVGETCSSNSLCIEPVCFGMTEGVVENTDFIQNLCWHLSLPCLKDWEYSDMYFQKKLKRHFAMFFHQGPAVLEAFERVTLLRESIKIVATNRSHRYSGPEIGGANNIPLPFWFDQTDPLAFPDFSAIAGGVGGLNLLAFKNFLYPRLFQTGLGGFGGVQSVRVYGLRCDYNAAKEQTASVADNLLQRQIVESLGRRGMADSGVDVGDLLGEFIEDPLFPTFKPVSGGTVPVTAERLEPSTIAGYVQTMNPEHPMQEYRGLLLVPDNCMFRLIAPPSDDYSSLGLGPALDFASSTPGYYRIMSSKLFSTNQIGEDGVVSIGYRTDANGNLVRSYNGIKPRDKALREAIRTDVLLTYSSLECASSGQYPNVGPAAMPQGPADGFRLKSLMHIGTEWEGVARPVLLLFKVDQPRSAQPIEVCQVESVTVDQSASNGVADVCGGNSVYAMVTFQEATVTDDFDVGDAVVYRTGPKGATFLADVTARSADGKTITIESSANPQEILPACQGQKDDYGVMAELLNATNATAVSSEIMKASYDAANSELDLELFDALAAQTDQDTGTITLDDGTVINVIVEGNAAAGVFVSVSVAGGETCDLADLDCACLAGAVFTNTA